MFGGNLVRLNVFETVSSECSKVVVWGQRTPLVVMECAETALQYMNDIL